MKIKRVCPVCNKQYLAEPTRLKHGRQTTCSRACSYAYRSIIKGRNMPCCVCGRHVWRSPSTLKSKTGHVFCSPACHYKGRSLGLSQRPECGPYGHRHLLIKESDANTPKTIIVDDAFGNWIAGMTDGDGCFDIAGHKSFTCRFKLGLREDDFNILQCICNTLNIGSLGSCIGYHTSKPVKTWHTNSKDDCLALISLFDKYQLRTKKRQDYLIWRKAVLIWTTCKPTVWSAMKELKEDLIAGRYYNSEKQVNPASIPDWGFEDWLAGFIAAEGCFRVHKARKGKSYSCCFTLKLRNDDSKILEHIKNKTGFGRLTPERRQGNPCLTWSVDTKDDCVKLVNFMTDHPIRSKKAVEFCIWKEAVEIWLAHHPDRRARLINLKEQLETAKKYVHLDA